MTLADLGSIGSFLAAIAVFITLIYIARQVRQANILTRYQARQAMMEKDLESLQAQIDSPEITLPFVREQMSEVDLFRLHLFLTRIMRQREWEWFQYRDGVIDERVFRTFHPVIVVFLGTPRTRYWWETLGRSGLDPEFVREVDALLAKSEPTPYWSGVRQFIDHELR